MTYLYALLASLSPLGMDSYLPAIPQFAENLRVTDAAASWTLSIFLIGLGMGQLFGGAISDQKGRRMVALSGLLVFILSSVMIVLLPTWLNVMILRFFQGVGGGFMIVAAFSMLKDTTSSDCLAERMAQAVFVVMIMPVIAPILGSLLLVFGWQSIFIMCAVVGVFVLAIYFFKVPETNPSFDGKVSFKNAFKQYWYVMSFRRNGYPVALLQALTLSFCASATLTFVIVAPKVLMTNFGLNPQQFSWAFALVVTALLIGNRIGKRMLKFYRCETILGFGVLSQLIAVSLFFFSSILFNLQLLEYIFASMIIVSIFSAVAPAGQAVYLNMLDKNYGTATAMENTMRFSLGGLAGGLAVNLPYESVTSVAMVLLITSALGACAYWWCKLGLKYAAPIIES